MTAKPKLIYDPLYGFIQLTSLEWDIIHTPFYQRLRWIKQLGFSSYTFYGAEHSRFGHSLGVMFNAHSILKSIEFAVPEEELFDDLIDSDEKKYHQSIRLAALLHDLGTFPFSHTTEMAYIRYGETTNQKGSKGHPDDHEHLGSFIIKNTDYEGGITHLIKHYGLDPQRISNLVKGIDHSILANQILHSEIDCDRMDYLLRDAHYTGLQYGNYDRDYLLHHFKTVEVGGHNILVIGHSALHCVEDFLMARFAWYSQVVRSARGAKFDAIAEEVTFYLLEKNLIRSYSDLLEDISNSPDIFYTFNDQYFMNLIHDLYMKGTFDKNLRIKDMVYSLLYAISPKTIRADEFKQRILKQNDDQQNEKILKKTKDKIEQIKEVLRKNGSEKDWLLADIPNKNIVFVKSMKKVLEGRAAPNILLERDPAKILMNDGKVALLGEVENSIISQLENSFNFVPNVYCSESAFEILKSKGIV